MNVKTQMYELMKSVEGLPNKDKNDILELLEHDEWGVAFEILCSTIQQEKIDIKLKDFNVIFKIGSYMEMEVELWEDIEPRDRN